MFKLMTRLSLAFSVLVLFVARSAVALPQQPVQPSEMRVTFVNVGSGLCIVIECPTNEANAAPPPIVYDCGAAIGNGAGLTQQQAVQSVANMLAMYNRRPVVFVSHPHVDHYSYIPQIIAFPNPLADSIWLGGEVADYNQNFQQWLNTQQGAFLGPPPVITFPSQAFGEFAPPIFKRILGMNPQPQPVPTCGAAKIELLTVNSSTDNVNPNNPNAGEVVNAKSLILRIVYNKFSVTLTGDATAESLASLLANYHMKDLETTVMSAPHHGANTHGSGSPSWARVFQPKIVVYSAGDPNQFHHPQCAPVRNYDNFGFLKNAQAHPLACEDVQNPVQVLNYGKAQYLTRTDGSTWITSNGEEVHVACDGIDRNNVNQNPAPVINCDIQ
jgi:beta-lactamase superfamily II metal-dependent hydrolase